MRPKIKIFVACLILGMTLFLGGCGCKSSNTVNYSLTLEIWGLFDDQDAYAEIFENYRKLYPQVTNIEYKKLTVDTYKNEILEALASGQGPDIFLIGNTWLPSFFDKIEPAPAQILNEKKFRTDFVDVVAQDFIADGLPYAVPLSVDSLGLYYNKDLFNAAGITAPPKNWSDFVEVTKMLTRVDSYGRIVYSGAAMGTAYNINRSTDILGLLMLQNGTNMVDFQAKRALFDQLVKKGDEGLFPGENALSFYTQFAKSNSSFYSWNPNMHYSIDVFSEGTVGMMFNYSWQIDMIAKKAPKLNFAVAPVPQLPGSTPVNYANYWGFAVAKNKTAKIENNRPAVSNEIRITESWRLLNFLATRPEGDLNIVANVAGSKKVIDPKYDPTIDYIQKTGKPAARRDLLEVQKSDARIGAFAFGNLIAKSWPQIDPNAIENIFAEMISQVNNGAATTSEAIKAGAAQVSLLMNQ